MARTRRLNGDFEFKKEPNGYSSDGCKIIASDLHVSAVASLSSYPVRRAVVVRNRKCECGITPMPKRVTGMIRPLGLCVGEEQIGSLWVRYRMKQSLTTHFRNQDIIALQSPLFEYQ